MPTAKVTIKRADNEIAVFVNGILAYDKKTEGDPPLNDVVDISGFLQHGCCNSVVIIGINWGGPAHYEGSLTVDNSTTAWAFQAASTVNGMVFDRSFTIPGP
jgi:hypothetical protein